ARLPKLWHHRPGRYEKNRPDQINSTFRKFHEPYFTFIAFTYTVFRSCNMLFLFAVGYGAKSRGPGRANRFNLECAGIAAKNFRKWHSGYTTGQLAGSFRNQPGSRSVQLHDDRGGSYNRAGHFTLFLHRPEPETPGLRVLSFTHAAAIRHKRRLPYRRSF